MADTLTIGLLQHVSTPNDIQSSLQRMQQRAKEAAEQGASLLLFPEASLTGYNNTLEQTQAIAQTREGEITQALCKIAQDNHIALAYGFAERDGEDIFNSALLIDATGKPQLRYRKTHLWGDQDRTLFSPGNQHSDVIEIDGWSIGFLICYDIEFPENVRHLALSGAELILTPTALMKPWSTVADKVVNIRAYENQLYIAYANFCGAEHEQQYVGHSCIAGPAGNVLAKADTQETLLMATLDKQHIKDMQAAIPYLHDRRPELYRSIADKGLS